VRGMVFRCPKLVVDGFFHHLPSVGGGYFCYPQQVGGGILQNVSFILRIQCNVTIDLGAYCYFEYIGIEEIMLFCC
jgi:hypothetical protein